MHRLLASDAGHPGAAYRRTHAGRPPIMTTPEAAFVGGWVDGGGASQKACGQTARGAPAAPPLLRSRAAVGVALATFSAATIIQLNEELRGNVS